MNDSEKWHENNDRYLAAALAWLRLLLTGQTKAIPSGQSFAAATAAKPSGWFGMRRPQSQQETSPEEDESDEIAAAFRTMTEAAETDPPPALVILGRCLGLSEFEQEILLLCTAMELDTGIPSLCAQYQKEPSRAYPTFALAFTLFNDPSWDALSADRPLRYLHLIEINQPGATPLTLSAIRADERIVNYIKGLNQLDDRLTTLIAPFEVQSDGESALAPSNNAAALSIEHMLRYVPSPARSPVVQLTGMDRISKQQVALTVFSRLGMQGFRLLGEQFPTAAGEVETFVRLWHRESLLLPLALYIDVSEPEDITLAQESGLAINRFIARSATLIFVGTREPRPGLGVNAPSFEIDKPTPAEQLAAWKDALGEHGAANAERLAGQFNLCLPAIHRIASSVMADEEEGNASSSISERLWQTCLNRTRPKLDRLARRIEAKAGWDDLVLPEEPLKLLREIATQVRQRSKVYDEWGFRQKMSRGFGISALFAGESGTGKTMAAEVLAQDLHLDLYRIDLSAVVSKYIGETEKNLGRVFDAAEDGSVILLFDEADALFGKRSEVKDSRDRYANIEINYLLQRMEAFRGLAILATNMKSALDGAFMRRLRFIVNIPFPGPTERKLIWEGVFPKDDHERNLAGTPVEGLDYRQLTRLNLAGGSIHNVALNAAFLAAKNHSPVTMPLLFEAARTEFRKLDKPVNDADFRLSKSDGAKT